MNAIIIVASNVRLDFKVHTANVDVIDNLFPMT